MALRGQSRGKDRDKDKPAADLLRRTLASSVSAPGSDVDACPDPEILAAYADRALDAAETAYYELHFSQCAHCREQLATMVRAAETAPNAGVPRTSWIWDWRLLALAPVTAALIIAVVFFARRPAASRVAGQQALVAMQTPSQEPVPSAAPEPLPQDRVPEMQEAPPAKTAVPPSASRMRSDAGSIERSAADFTADVKSESDQAKVSPAPEEKELGRDSISHLPLQSRNMIQLDKSVKQAAPPRAESSAQTGDSNELPRSASQTVTVYSQNTVATTAPVPNQVSKPAAAGAVSGGNAAGQPDAAMAKKAPAYATKSSTGLAATETVTLEAPTDRDARTIVRSPDPQILWRISSGRYVERSSDAGTTWRAQWTSVNAHVVAGSAPSVETCWLVGRGGIVLLTTDGTRWRTIDPPANADFVAVDASDAVSATVTSTDGRKFETGDAGKHWTSAP
jgi:hypothetical protein